MLSPIVLVALSGTALVEPPPPTDTANQKTRALVVGAAIDAVTFAVGVALVGTDTAGFDQARAGWITCSAGFTIAPFVAHAMVGEWLRGAAFSAVPLATTIGNAVVLGSATSQTIDVTPLNQDQRFIVLFTSIGMLGSVIGLLDVALFKPAKVHVAPNISQHGGGFVIGGSF
jgi:hypothetical protein